MRKEKVITLIIIFSAIVCLSIIIVPLVIKYYKDQDKQYFPEYNNIEIDEELLKDDITYDDIKKQFENDYYFSKLAIMFEYDKKNYSFSTFEDMIRHFIFNYELSNDKYFSHTDSKNGRYCFSKNNLINAFKELYDMDITDKYSYLEGYYKYVYVSGKGYCFDFKRIASEFDKNIKVGIERMSILGTTVTTDIYVYEYYAATNNEKYYENLLSEAISKKNYTLADTIINKYLNGTVTHKQLQFKKNSRGKYFKYKVLVSKKLLY